MSQNKSRLMLEAVRRLDHFLEIDGKDRAALPGAALHHVKEARKILLKDIRKVRERAAREVLWAKADQKDQTKEDR